MFEILTSEILTKRLLTLRTIGPWSVTTNRKGLVIELLEMTSDGYILLKILKGASNAFSIDEGATNPHSDAHLHSLGQDTTFPINLPFLKTI